MSDKPNPLNGEPFYCRVCGAGYGEYLACEEPGCALETREEAAKRIKLAEDIANGNLS